MLKITHNAGFFSCLSIRLEKILEYFNNNKVLPDVVDSSEQFREYKVNPSDDLTHYFFIENNIDIPYITKVEITSTNNEPQFSDYKLLNFNAIKPFIDKYFSITPAIGEKINFLETKYKIEYDNICAVRYRGNDKAIETNAPTYSEIIEQAKKIKLANPQINFVLQSDESEFLENFINSFPESIIFQEIPPIKKCNMCPNFAIPIENRLTTISYFLASIKIISKAKYIITTSGNGELWVCIFRGNADGVYQYLNPKEYIYGVKNESYQKDKTTFWLNCAL